MDMPPRLEASGVLHHVIPCVLEREQIFRDDHGRDDSGHRLVALVEASRIFV